MYNPTPTELCGKTLHSIALKNADRELKPAQI